MISTGEALGSGAEKMPPSPEEGGVIQIVDAVTGSWRALGAIPAYPFAGDLTVAVSPDGTTAAVVAPLAAFEPEAGKHFPHTVESDWFIEKRIGLVALDLPRPIQWLALPETTPYPLDLLAWSPDSRHVALRARHDGFDEKPALLVLDAKSGRAAIIHADRMDQAPAGTVSFTEPQLAWIDPRRMLVRLRAPKGDRLDWWRIGLDGSKKNLTAAWKTTQPAIRRLPNGAFAAIAGKTVVALNPRSGRTVTLADVSSEDASFVAPVLPSSAATPFVSTSDAEHNQIVRAIDAAGSLGRPVVLPETATPITGTSSGLLWQFGDETGLFLNETDLSTGRTARLLSLNTGLASLALGRTTFFDYSTTDGKPEKGAAILPPDYRPGSRYPTLVWVYDGYSVAGHGDYFLDPQMAGVYNLQLYAAKGYVVLLPSMPLPWNPERKDVYAAVTNGVLPAIDKLSAMGIADTERVGVFGQSYGGYSVYALLTQTARFNAGVAMAGLSPT